MKTGSEVIAHRIFGNHAEHHVNGSEGPPWISQPQLPASHPADTTMAPVSATRLVQMVFDVHHAFAFGHASVSYGQSANLAQVRF